MLIHCDHVDFHNEGFVLAGCDRVRARGGNVSTGTRGHPRCPEIVEKEPLRQLSDSIHTWYHTGMHLLLYPPPVSLSCGASNVGRSLKQKKIHSHNDYWREVPLYTGTSGHSVLRKL